jgi:AcrR family transcriptional regulator
MVTKARLKSSVTVRDAAATRERILEATGRLILRDGLGAVGVNALAREVGCDKVLIYRYFGDLDGVHQAFAAHSDFWWTLGELTAGIEPGKTGVADALKLIIRRHAKAVRARPVTLEVLAAELVTRSALVVALESVRERRTLELNRWIAEHYRLPKGLDLEAIGLLLGSAVNYLAARARKIKVMSGVALASDDGWERVLVAADSVIDGLIRSP